MNFPNRQKFNFDTALRYYPVVEKLNKSKFSKEAVLEVGSGTNGISDFYKGEVIGVDADFSKTSTDQNPNIRHLKGLITVLPFTSNKFHFVVCMDTLEHLSDSLRTEAVKELLRVTRKDGVVFLGFPTGNLSARVEGWINYWFKRIHQKEHVWLLEHKKLGLPNEESVLLAVKENGIKSEGVTILKNANLFMWFLIHWFFTVHPSKIYSRILKYGYVPIFYLLKINLPPFYRTILIIKK